MQNNTNGLIINGSENHVNSTLIFNNTNSLILNGNNNLFNGSGALNGTNGFFITGTGNSITNNSVSNQNNTAMYINGDNIVTGNSLTDNNGTGLLIRSDNDVVDFLNMIGNTIIRNGQGINIQGNNNNINNILTLFNILLDNGYSLTITGNNNQMNSTILTLNKNGLQVNGNNNSFSNVTSRFNNQTGIILNGNNNTLNGSLLQNNTNGLIINGSENHVNSTLIFNNTNGSTINGNNNNLTGNNVHNNTENGLIINGSNNTFVQNNITGNPNAILVENGTNNTLNFNRVAGNTHNLHNNGYGTVDAQYNWWGQNNPICITGMNINTGNHAVAVLNVPSGTINPGQVYDITVTLKSSTGEELKMEIPSFMVQFFINNGGDVYPETAPLINNSAWTQLQVFNPGSYTLTATIDQQTLTNMLSTPVNSQPVTPHKIPRKIADPAPNNNLCGAIAVGNLLNSLGAKADANLISQIGGLTDQGISMYGLSQAASYYGIQLTGLKIDSGQLKNNDIVLLNINGNNHYALILGKIGDNYIIQDPFLGTVIMTTEQFNKYYTGNALTTNPNGRGTPLSTEEMKGLFGGVVFLVPVAYIAVCAIILGGTYLAVTYGPEFNKSVDQARGKVGSYLADARKNRDRTTTKRLIQLSKTETMSSNKLNINFNKSRPVKLSDGYITTHTVRYKTVDPNKKRLTLEKSSKNKHKQLSTPVWYDPGGKSPKGGKLLKTLAGMGAAAVAYLTMDTLGKINKANKDENVPKIGKSKKRK
ncbi:MAG: hypothetical protein HZC47_04595 [Methanobacterium sp.]|uniref:cysteine peptidase family C39 domain-containing protein n=1 Tax=Methanobacterium sp. TaxID=2164 RepID=UPI003D64645D|nr:hypothetical protein [Methanobacterium sp.]